MDFTVPESSLSDALPICDVPSAVNQGLPLLQHHWDVIIAKLKDAYRGETELTGIVEDFDGLHGDTEETSSSVSVIGRRLAHSLRLV